MGTVSMTVLMKSLTVRALEIGPRGPAGDGRPSLSAPCALTGPGVPCPSIRSHLLGLSPPCCSTDLESFSPLVSSDTFSFLFDHVRLPGHHFPSFFSSHRPRLVEIILWVSALFPKDSVIPPLIWGSTGT